MDGASDVRPSDGERRVDAPQRLGGRLERPDRVAEVAAAAVQAGTGPVEQRLQIVRVSASSDASTSSRFTSGAVWETGIVPPSGRAGASSEPGSSSTTMSLRPVLGRSSMRASRLTVTSPLSSSIRTTALPPSRSTREISPTRTPATLTVCPCPGVTAWAVENSPLKT